MALSRKEVEEIKPWLKDTVKKRLGYSEKSVVNAAIQCLQNNLDKDSASKELTSLLDDLAPRFVDDLFTKLDRIRRPKTSSRSNTNRKRTLEDVFGDSRDNDEETRDESETLKKRKKTRFEALKDDNEPLPPPVPEPVEMPAPLNANQISAMLEKKKKELAERKEQLEKIRQQTMVITQPMVQPTTEFIPPMPQQEDTMPPPSLEEQQALMNEAIEKARKAAHLHNRIQSKFTYMGNTSESIIKSGAVDLSAINSKPSALILDDKGRAIDSSGKAVSMMSRMPTLKANIRAKKREAFLKVEKPTDDFADKNFFDARVSAKPNTRTKRAFKFHEKGKFQQIAQKIRAKAQLEKLQAQIAAAAKKTGISSATKLALITPSKEVQLDTIPEVEWWDAAIMPNMKYEAYQEVSDQDKPNYLRGLTSYIEHPIQRHPPAEPKETPVVTMILTKKERKKMRTQRRREVETEKQEKIRLGLEPPPPPKVKISNLMRVLGSEAVQDPTKVEAHVRAQMAQRQRAHEAANEARKLTPAARREKTKRKLNEDTSLGVHVSLYQVKDLHHPQKQYKVDVNARQLYMTGCVVLIRDMNLVVVEGGPKAQKKFRRLMLNRIKWSEDSKKRANSDDEDEKTTQNFCRLVWEGTEKKRRFSDFKMKTCANESAAREYLKTYGVEHYWDLSISESLLEGAED
ncbi:U4/U6 small nuclear ribonucleoprotein Prp3-like [Dendronephthya gigantea]|uniref:U4/U6 small nuclear ribonucleoprotein Prp3-like n=1 Tax=Dendronephthya gigantea TaxID=151771 RepID=UPI00106D90E2|nr:U4/U6 small nuclear ribonucleoprotein Prp3-like [Dendronephthya gigantea]